MINNADGSGNGDGSGYTNCSGDGLGSGSGYGLEYGKGCCNAMLTVQQIYPEYNDVYGLVHGYGVGDNEKGHYDY